MTTATEQLLSRGLLPDAVVRYGIRRLLRRRLRALHDGDPVRQGQLLTEWIASLDQAPVAIEQDAANAQHYEVPPAFYGLVLGRHRKYSCGYWPQADMDLDAAEAAMLELTCERAGLEDGMRVLDLGCGWGALSLWIAARYPRCQVLAASNSANQRAFIESQRDQRGLRNLECLRADMSQAEPPGRFDRVLSVEMFEHLRNWRRMFARVARWLDPDGRFFLHVFTHRSTGYAFADRGAGDWMARRFFTGGQMPADAQPLHLQDDLAVERHWRVPGTHYQRTAEAWLQNLDRNRDAVARVLGEAAGNDGRRAANEWRVFFMACAELWGFRQGSEWLVSHYLLRPRA